MRRTPIFSIALTICACSMDRGSSTFEDQSFADAGIYDVRESADATLGSGSGAATMAGTWLLVHEASTCVVVAEQLTWASYLIEIEQQGRVLTERRRVCELSLSEVLGQQIDIPDQTRAALQFTEVDRGFVSSLAVGGSYSSSTELAQWGVDLVDPVAEDVPTDAEDERVFDADEDGHPGVTFVARGTSCERYVAQRQLIRYSGTFARPNQVDGESITVTDSNVLGSSQPLCGVAPRITANDAHSRFRMVRVDGAGESVDLDTDGNGEVSCDEAAPYFLGVLERRESDPAYCE